ncbi:MAG: GFA family protein [Polyangiales bacterium]
MSAKYTGSCLCGKIRYEIRGELGAIVFCHCGQCRKAQGSAFASNAEVKRDAFVLLAGTDVLASHTSSPGKRRHFCRACGSPLYSERDGLPVLRLRIGTLDTPISAQPTAHIYAGSKAEWFDITDALPQHAELEPARG